MLPNIRPVSDLRNHFAEITRDALTSGEPVFLTKNGVGSLVVMSMEQYDQQRYDSWVYDRLMEAQIEAETTDVRYTLDEVLDAAEAVMSEAMEERRGA